MSLPTESMLLRVFCLAGDHTLQAHRPLHQAIVAAARAAGLAGATVLPGQMGLGRAGHIYSNLMAEVNLAHRPVVVEIVDEPARLDAFLPTLHELVQGRRLITLERAEVLRYAPESPAEETP